MKKATLLRLEALEARAAVSRGDRLLTGGGALVRGEPRYVALIEAGHVERVDHRGWLWLGDYQVAVGDEPGAYDVQAA